MSDSGLFRQLDSAEAERFRQWARDHYTPRTAPSGSWHPTVREEWARLDAEHDARVERDRALHAAFSAGNYASAYETTDYAEASQGLTRSADGEYRTAFLLGFFASFERDEVPSKHQAEYDAAATSDVAGRLVELGVLDRCWLVLPGPLAEVAP